jgi:hypothetical protein
MRFVTCIKHEHSTAPRRSHKTTSWPSLKPMHLIQVTFRRHSQIARTRARSCGKQFRDNGKYTRRSRVQLNTSRILPGIRLRSSPARPAICTCSQVYRLLSTCADLTGSSRECPKRLDTCDSTLVTLWGCRVSVYK